MIEDFAVVRKQKLAIPDTVEGIFACPNSNCVSHVEPVQSHFSVRVTEHDTKMKCKYCEKVFSKDIVVDVR
ncbi:Aspartate carbamoyltransferase regulatory chain [compost metagenome]